MQEAVEIDPANSIKYKVADYARGTRNSKALFTRTMLKGGPSNTRRNS